MKVLKNWTYNKKTDTQENAWQKSKDILLDYGIDLSISGACIATFYGDTTVYVSKDNTKAYFELNICDNYYYFVATLENSEELNKIKDFAKQFSEIEAKYQELLANFYCDNTLFPINFFEEKLGIEL